MKKFWKSLFIVALGAFTFSSCEDVPEPYDLPNQENNGGSTVVEPEGEGTIDSPFNIAAVNKFIEEGTDLDRTVYIKGIVSSTKEISPSFGNATFYISEDGSTKNQFYIYRCFGLNNNKITSEDEIKVGDEVVICGKVTNYNGTFETVQNQAFVYSINGKTSDTGGEAGEATGDGTLENPFNSVAAAQYATSLGSGVNSPKEVYIKGKVVSVSESYDNSFGNGSFYISDDGTTAGQFLVYRAMYLGNQKYTSGDLLKAGDEVIVYGKVVNYMGNTPETVQGSAYLYSLNGKTATDTPVEPGTATGDGTLENPFNSVAANAAAAALEAGAESEVVYIKGKVVSVRENYGTQFGNASFYISDDGKADNQFYVFRALYLNNEKYTAGELLQPGDDVVVCGKLTNYMGNTPETVANESYLYSLTSNGGGEEENPGGDVSGNSITLAPSSLGLENGAYVETQKLTDGTTLVFEQNGNSNGPKYYKSGSSIRMYPKNSVTVKSSKTIKSITFKFDEFNGTTYNASGDMGASAGTVNVNGNVGTVNDINANETTITNTSSITGAASQMRITSIVITYAE